jgi:threonine dehydratase
VDEVVLVEDDAMRDAVRYLLDRLKIVAEPSGAITVAALRSRVATPRGVTVAILSGGNMEWSGLRELLPDG